jgi:hypothetical protein
MSTDPTHGRHRTEAGLEAETDVAARVDTQTHGTPDVLDDGDTARVVEGDAAPGPTRTVATDDVLDDGETSRAVEGERTRYVEGENPTTHI